MTIVSGTAVALAIAFLVLAAVVAVFAVVAITDFVIANRKARLARHESFRTYYRGLVVSH